MLYSDQSNQGQSNQGYKLGRTAAYEKKAKFSNPYKALGESCAEWLLGWNHGMQEQQKRSNHIAVIADRYI